jgi:hypothetical protein
VRKELTRESDPRPFQAPLNDILRAVDESESNLQKVGFRQMPACRIGLGTVRMAGFVEALEASNSMLLI